MLLITKSLAADHPSPDGSVLPIPIFPELSIFKRLLPPVTKLRVLVPEEYKPVSVSPSKVREGCDADPNSSVSFDIGESVVRRVPPAVGRIKVWSAATAGAWSSE